MTLTSHYLQALNFIQNDRDRSESPSSSYHDFDEDEDRPGIHHGRFDPDEARSLFSSAQIDARDVDFSDRVTAKRKSYKVSTRRQGKDGVEEYGDFSDEDEESLERRYARLRSEIEEIKEAYSKRNAEKGDATASLGPEGQDISQLSRILDGIETNPPPGSKTNGVRLTKNLGTGIRANGPPQSSQASNEAATYTVTYAPTYQQSHALAKAADFDSRLALLEKVLGMNTIDLPTTNGSSIGKAVIPTLDTLQRQISLIQDSTPSSLDVISRRVRNLTQEADRLEDSRKNAKAAQDALRGGGDAVPDEREDAEQVAKINALFGTLSTINDISPSLPFILDRLWSLRAIHADAATASESLRRVEKKQADMVADIKKWVEGLKNVEEALEKGESLGNGNGKIVEGWVKELEMKMGRL